MAKRRITIVILNGQTLCQSNKCTKLIDRQPTARRYTYKRKLISIDRGTLNICAPYILSKLSYELFGFLTLVLETLRPVPHQCPLVESSNAYSSKTSSINIFGRITQLKVSFHSNKRYVNRLRSSHSYECCLGA